MPFPKKAAGSSIFLTVYKVLGAAICRVAKRCFPNGFLGILVGPGMPPALRAVALRGAATVPEFYVNIKEVLMFIFLDRSENVSCAVFVTG